MAVVGSRVFGGMAPRVDDELLAETLAVDAVNAKLTGGKLDPWRAPALALSLASIAPVLTVYRFGQNIDSEIDFWFEFTTDVDIVKGPVAGDTQERTYWTDGVFPKRTNAAIATASPPYPTNSFRLGVPAPSVAPALVINGTPDEPTDPATTAVYVVTYVTAWGEESAPSPASVLVTTRPGQTVTVTLPGNISGAYDVAQVRIYRSATGTSRTTFQFVDERAIGTASYIDSKVTSALGEVLATFDWLPPPDTLRGLRYMGNEILAGFFDSTLCFCEPGVPYAWPVKYQLGFSSPIVGIGAFGQSLFVGTARGTYLVTGVDPAQMVQETLSETQSCVSKRSIVEMMGGVVWASPDGLWFVGAGGAQSLTEVILDRDEWQFYKPESISGYTLDGRYYAVYDNGIEQGTLIFTFGDKASFVRSDETWTAGFLDKLRDRLFVVQGSNLSKWDDGEFLTLSWTSKDYRFPGTACMSSARVEADAYPVTFRLLADGAQRGPDITVSNNAVFRLPSGRAFVYGFEVEGATKINSVFIATSAKELGSA